MAPETTAVAAIPPQAPYAPPGTIPFMAERSAVERELEEIGTQLAWVRDYL